MKPEKTVTIRFEPCLRRTSDIRDGTLVRLNGGHKERVGVVKVILVPEDDVAEFTLPGRDPTHRELKGKIVPGVGNKPRGVGCLTEHVGALAVGSLSGLGGDDGRNGTRDKARESSPAVLEEDQG